MAQPVPYSQWNHFQLSSSSSSWPVYYELPDPTPWQTTHFNYADSAADLPDSSPSPFNHHDSLPGSSRSSRRPSSPLSLSVKEEPDDAAAGCFVMELFGRQAHSTRLSQSLAPPTEVPLRATQASSDMRRMMTVFRLNPFAMHNGEGRGTVPVHHEEAHALDAEPLIFEFQLDIDGLSLDSEALENPSLAIELKDADSQGLRSFSPDFELHQESVSGVNDDPGEEWRGYQHAETSPPLTMPSQRHSRGVLPFSSPTLHQHHQPQHNFSNTGLGSRRQPRLHNSASHPYLQKAAVAADSGYASSSSSSGIHNNTHIHPHNNTHAHAHVQQHHQHSPHHYQPHHRVVDTEAHTSWITTPSSSLRYDSNSNPTSAEPSSSSRSSSSSLGRSMSTYADVNLPSELSLVPVRRWSLPDANSHPHPHPNAYPPHAQLNSHSQLHLAAPLPFTV